MKQLIQTQILVLTWFAMGVTAHSAVVLPQEPAELKETANEFINLRIRDGDEPMAKRRQTLKENYRKALKKAESEATSRGDLVTVIELRKELDRLKAKNTAPDTSAYQSERVKGLLKTLVKHDQKLKAEDLEIRRSLANQLAEQLKSLQIDLTKQGRVEDAIAVKAYSESAGVVDLVVGEPDVAGHDAMRHLIALVFNPDNPAVGPGESPLPPGALIRDVNPPSEGTRVIMVPLEGGANPPSTFRSIALSDPRNLVFVGRTILPDVGFINREGSLVYWQDGQPGPEIIRGSSRFCEASFGIPLVGLNDDGTLVCSDDPGTRDSVRTSIRMQDDVTEISVTSSVISVVRSNGRAVMLGPRADIPTPALIATFNDVQSVAFSGAAFASVVKKDGSIIDINNGIPSEVGYHKKIERAVGFRTGIEKESGRVVNWSDIPQNFLNEIETEPRQLYIAGGYVAAIRANGTFFMGKKSETGTWEEMEDYDRALDDVVSFTVLIDSNQSWIVALLPATSVERSGVWSLEELVAARNLR